MLAARSYARISASPATRAATQNLAEFSGTLYPQLGGPVRSRRPWSRSALLQSRKSLRFAPASGPMADVSDGQLREQPWPIWLCQSVVCLPSHFYRDKRAWHHVTVVVVGESSLRICERIVEKRCHHRLLLILPMRSLRRRCSCSDLSQANAASTDFQSEKDFLAAITPRAKAVTSLSGNRKRSARAMLRSPPR
jgi:hypothetical protein